MRHWFLPGLAAGLLLSTAIVAGAGEDPPEDPKLPAAGYRLLQSYRQISQNFLDAFDDLLAVKDGDPRQVPKGQWAETCLQLSSALSQYLQDANAQCLNDQGAGGLPVPVMEWSTQETIRLSAVAVDGEQLFHTRNLMAQICHDMEASDLAAFGKKMAAIWAVADEVDREYQRLSAQRGRLGSLTKQQLEADQKTCQQTVFLLSALLAKCWDLEEEMKAWHKGLFTPADLKSKIDYRLSQLVFDKDAEPLFFGHVEKWKASLDAWQKKYASFHAECGKMVEKWANHKENFRGHGKALEGLTYDEIKGQVKDSLTDMANKITAELSGR